MESELYKKAMVFFNDARLTEKWLNHPCPLFNNATPLEMYASEDGRKKILHYLDVCNGDSSASTAK
ncbi:MbcA/ParS/Xre antitoxin family protein [Planctobacterium marinum]|uniref:MbcA/ParS/Xre antitoxin family protein n=1 Tax=Planctobacterium marinum TaxID=1631968 RepID=UPI001E29FEB5|nr:MbcA/ParS/Xre antitoxin family protein [Planctobacterium marinum]MCC2604951.1 MbcA/ParS/Xre antitoxin family protein [Planctobacterium marinum]